MSEQRFYITDTGLGLDTESDEMYSFGDEEDFCRLFDKLNEQQATIEHLRKQIQIYEQLLSNSYVGEEETLDGFVGKYVIWEDELQKYKEKIKGVFNE